MTDNEIIKGLMCHTNIECSSCPFNGHGCSARLFGKTVEMISRLKVENKSLKEKKSENFDQWQILDKRTKERYADLYEEAKEVVRTEAIKGFAEKLKERFFGKEYEYERMYIDNLAKEMMGADNGDL